MRLTYPPTSLMKSAVAEIRDEETDSVRFRRNLQNIGRYLSYEASKYFEVEKYMVSTPLAEIECEKIKHEIVILSVLRAALPMVEGVLSEFEEAALGVVSASRDKMIGDDGKQFTIKSDYIKIPDIENKIVILVDPMLATGSTILYILEKLKGSKPVKLLLFSAIASEYGITQIENHYPEIDILVGAVDPILNSDGYIVPGLGDAGDRAFNTLH